MRNDFYETFSSSQNTKNYTKTLLKNCGFSPNFFNDLEENVIELEKCYIKKIKSANDISLFEIKEEKKNKKKIYEAEDKDIFDKNKIEFKKNMYFNSNSNNSINNNFSSYTTIPSQDCLNKNINDIYNTKNKSKYYISSYKSKHKMKFSKFYEINSITMKENNKFKLYHKCCYPGCNRTFSSSGWLKAHLKGHLKQIHNSNYCKLFEKYLNDYINSLNEKNGFYHDFKKNSILNKSNSNNCENISVDNPNNFFLYSGLNSPVLPHPLYENQNILNIEKNILYIHHFKNESYKINCNN